MKSLCLTVLPIMLCLMALRAQDADNGSAAVPVEPAPLPSAQKNSVDDEINAKEAEIARLKKQLEQANGEIQALHKQNTKLQTSDSTLKNQIQASGVPLPRPAPTPLAAAPTGAPLASPDVFWYFHNSPDAANQYLTGKRFTITGRLVGFDPPVMSHVFGLQLESGDPNLRVICQFKIPPAYVAVYFQRRTGRILGKTAGGTEDTLLNINDAITVEGQCKGLDDGDVLLSRCRLIL